MDWHVVKSEFLLRLLFLLIIIVIIRFSHVIEITEKAFA